MHNLQNMLTLTIPLFILIGIGYAIVRAGWLSKDGARGLSWFIVNIGVPAAIFKALSSRSLSDILHVDYLLLYGIASLIPFSLLTVFALYRGRGLTKSAFIGLGGSISNSLMIGYPTVTALFGNAALVPFSLILIVENLVVLPLALALADTGKKQGASPISALLAIIPNLLRNPIIIAIIFGVAAASFDIAPPKILHTVIDMLAATVGAIALISVGAMLVGFNPKDMIGDVSTVVIGKLLIHPAAVMLMIMILPPIPPLYQSVAVIIAAMPMFSIYPVLGARYGVGGLGSAVLLPATLLSFITINALLIIWGV